MTKYKFKKGDKVYVHSSDTRNMPFQATITSSGNKWICIDKSNLKFHANSLDSEYGIYSLYPSKEEFEKEEEQKQIDYLKKLAEIN